MKDYWIMRLLGLTLCLLGLALYSVIAFATFVGLSDMSTQPNSVFMQLTLFLQYVVLVPGLIPLIVSVYLLVLFHTPYNFFVGLLAILPLIIVFHYVVVAFGLHMMQLAYLPLQTIEIGFGIAIVYMERKGIKPFE